MKKYIGFLATALCLVLTVKGQQISLFKNTKGLWGFKDKSGKVITEPTYYNKPSAFSEGRAVFTQGRFQGVLDENGKEIVAATYASVADFKFGFAVVTKEVTDTSKKVNGKPSRYTLKGIIDRTGKEIVPVQYKEMQGDFSNGWFVRVSNDPKEKIFINTSGKTFTVPDGMLLFDERIDGKKFIAMKNSKYGIIDQQFKELLPFEYSRIRTAGDDLLIVEQNNLAGLMNPKLKWVTKPAFASIYQFKNGFAIISNQEKLLGAINTKGTITTIPQFQNIYRIDKTAGAIAMYKGNNSDRHGLVDLATGKIISPADFNMSPYDYDWGQIKFRKDNKKGMMDSTGKELFYDAYDDFSPGFLENRAWVMKQKKYGFIDKTGTLVIPMKYDVVNGFNEGLAKVKLDGKCGYINTNGDVVIPLTFADAASFESGMAWVKDDTNRTFYIDKTGKEIK